MQCVNKNLREYRSLKKDSGLSDSLLSYLVKESLETLGRFPHLDEIDGANSESSIRESLKLNKNNLTDIETVLQNTNSESVEDANLKLNDKYRDKEIELITTEDKVLVEISERPSTNPKEIGTFSEPNVNSFHYFNEIIDKLNTLYGINVIPITTVELQDPKWRGIGDGAKAFIYNGDIYINTDIATVDSPVHEFLHILFGSMKYYNREMYDQIVSSAELFDSYNEIGENYPNRTREDINEEVFITELAKHLTGKSSNIAKLPTNIQYEIFYNINRTLDTMLMGDASVKCIPGDLLYQMSMKTLATLVNASSMQGDFLTALSNSMLSRILSNKKSELLKEGTLKEECS